jgi:anti-anti-sigma factor
VSEHSTRVGTSFASTGARIEEGSQPAGRALFSAFGELDLHVAPELQERIRAAIDREAELVVVDLSAVTFIDSMALGVLLGATDRLRRHGGDLRLVVPSPQLRRVFEIAQLDRIFSLDRTRESALGRPEPLL